jgi:hypothetical protein
MPWTPLTTYPTNRVRGQGGNLDYYIMTLLYNTPMRRWRLSMLTRRPPVDGLHDASGLQPSSVWLQELVPHAPTQTFVQESPEFSATCKTFSGTRKCHELKIPASGGFLWYPSFGGEGSPPIASIGCNFPGSQIWGPRKKYRWNFSKILLLCLRLFFPSCGFLLLPLDPPWRDHMQIRQNRIIRIEGVLMSLTHMARLDHNLKFLDWIFASPKKILLT